MREVSQGQGYGGSCGAQVCQCPPGDEKNSYGPIPGTGFCQSGCWVEVSEGTDGDWPLTLGPKPESWHQNKVGGCSPGQLLPSFLFSGPAGPHLEGIPQASTRAIGDNGLDHWQEEWRVPVWEWGALVETAWEYGSWPTLLCRRKPMTVTTGWDSSQARPSFLENWPRA